MKKIIAAIDGLKYSESTTLYAISIAKQTSTHLVGVFLDDFLYNSYNVYELIVKKDATPADLKLYDEKDKTTRLDSAKKFEAACREAGIEYSVHHDRNYAIQELKHESIYADLVIINVNETLAHHKEAAPTGFIRDLLGDVQCPVILVPNEFNPVNKLILLYDGEPSSVHAVKMFSYLLEYMKVVPAEVISVNPKDSSLHLPDNKLMKEFMKRHYPNAKFRLLKGKAEDEIVPRLKAAEPGTMVVLGAYRRSDISRLFRESMADVLMRETKLPLFIAHNK